MGKHNLQNPQHLRHCHDDVGVVATKTIAAALLGTLYQA